jgi:hypothetical protein
MILAALILAISGLFVAYERLQKRANVVDLTVASGLANAQFFLIETSIAGIQFRIIMFFLGLIYILYRISTVKYKLRHVFGLNKLTLYWVMFSFTILFSKGLNGSYPLSVETVTDFISRYGFALLCLWVFALASVSSAVSIARWLFLICLVNLTFAVLQLFGVGAAFDLQRSLYPVTVAYGDELIAQGLNSTFGYLPGLSPFSITTGYVFAVLAWLGVSFAAQPPKRFQTIGWTGLAVLICAVGGSIILSRSTVLAALFALVVLFLLPLVLRERRTNRPGTIAIVLLGGVGFVLVQKIAESYVKGGERLMQVGDEARYPIWEKSLSLILDHPFIGASDSVRYVVGLDIGAHNVLINALVQGGLITLTGLLTFLACAVRVSVICVRRTHPTFRDLSAALFCAQMMYLLKSMFHNESVFTSGILFMMIAGIIIGIPYHMPLRLSKQRMR